MSSQQLILIRQQENEEARFWDSLNHWRRGWVAKGNQQHRKPPALAPLAFDFAALREGLQTLMANNSTQIARMTRDAQHWAAVVPHNGSVLAWFTLQLARDLDWAPIETLMLDLEMYQELTPP